ncbi:EboA domain-containing protein [Algibacillus agarilyticus]|uniref:EboA domain-containing protein n=1 Tax=Algibacillus agarilyticus TaxID=2234133 RepID=UPI001300363A|nr:EboA domain-containing protein [Algibacillus agarilyticus]
MTQMTINLLDVLKQHSADGEWQWFDKKLTALANINADLNLLDIPLAMARRKMGHISITHPELSHWYTDDVARIVLLQKATETYLGDEVSLIMRAYQQGDEHEKETIIRGLCFVDQQGDLIELALDACRTNMSTMMSTIAFNNPFPARYFPEHEFNQMVLKSLFMGLDIDRVQGLAERTNESLSRMTYDFLRERIAASRPLPKTIWLAIRIVDVDDAFEIFQTYLISDDEAHRHFVLTALLQQLATNPSLIERIETHHPQESNAQILALINKTKQLSNGE